MLMKYLLSLSLMTLLVTGMGCTNKANVVATPSASMDDDTISVVAGDVYGKDLSGVERYPKSILSYYAHSDDATDVTYQTTASAEQVRTYFQDQLTKAGWKNSEEATDYMEYTKGDKKNQEVLTVYFTTYDEQGIVEYELAYEPAANMAE